MGIGELVEGRRGAMKISGVGKIDLTVVTQN
jgi:hypothetical protein